MPDIDLASSRRMPLADAASASPASSVVQLAAIGPRTRIALRARESARAAAGTALGLALPVAACRSAATGDVAALWLGPDEWLVIAPDGRSESLLPELAKALAGAAASVVDVSHRNTALAVTGPKAADVLNAFVPLDLAPEAFPVGACTRTLLAKSEIVLWRTAGDTFHIDCARSMSAYVWASLEEARREFLD